MTDPDQPPGRRPLWPLLLGVALLAAGGVTAASLVLRDRPAPTPTQRDLAREAGDDLERRNYRPLSGSLEALLTDPAYKPVPTQAHPLLGLPAPDFALTDTDGATVSLTQTVKRGPVVLVFYYGYHCDHCVSQLFALNKDVGKFRELGANVLSVSADGGDLTRERFQKYGAFSFPVLSDPGNGIAAKYGAYTPGAKPGDDGNLMHATFVIDPKGHVVWANRGDAPFTENRTLLVEIRRCTRP